MFGLFMAGWTVHYWDAIFVFFIFLLASGIWILDFQQDELDEDDGESSGAAAPRPHSPYTRFPGASGRTVTQAYNDIIPDP